MLLEVWNSMPETINSLKCLAKAILTIFLSTYSCESLFSTLNNVKSHNRNRLHDETSLACVANMFPIGNSDDEGVLLSEDEINLPTSEKYFSIIETKLRGYQRTNPDNCAMLKACVDYQIKKEKYYLDANLALLKLYQFDPCLYSNSEPIINILLKSIMNLPKSDFLACTALVNPNNISSEAFNDICDLHSLLDQCRFTEAWMVIDKLEPEIKPIKGFQQSIINYIVYVVGITYQTIKYSLFKSFLPDLEEDEVIHIIEAKEWEFIDDMMFISDKSSLIKSQNIDEKIKFEDLIPVVPSD
ncbi:hypothetical protein A3Q56_03062 [Intoshia linei]|uniref:Eukaryotic translation initiation factor 3 subunit K n=1 Tax=Intoshia linei TaxID=1819745 RepID=A0A177B4N6_9BILA|nr:hypothetical protein A3Q56_03062 [Intoshia linei]